MSEMVERVAREIDPEAWVYLGLDAPEMLARRIKSLERSRAAIVAMRRPTEAMMLVGAKKVWIFAPDYAPIESGKFDNEESAEYIAGEVWRAMTCKALK